MIAYAVWSACHRTVVSVGAALFLLQQFAGINAVVYFSTSVFRSAGITSDVSASALVGAANVFGTTVASSLMDKQGRKSLLLASFAGMDEYSRLRLTPALMAAGFGPMALCTRNASLCDINVPFYLNGVLKKEFHL